MIPARDEHWPLIWPFLSRIVAEGETYTYDRDISEEEARKLWLLAPPGHTIVATGPDGRVLGTAKMARNQAGPGSHVANASFMVDPSTGMKGAGRMLGRYMLEWARSEGFSAVQFNAVVETNTRAVKLWKSLGFQIIGTVPEAFDHPHHGRVGLHIMHRYLPLI
ncbi:MAG: GNAT family N-acetyltransferase [Sphingosinicella sp.]|nr:GNAT family N-acetyltransferase [Sphingosinicella sp.]